MVASKKRTDYKKMQQQDIQTKKQQKIEEVVRAFAKKAADMDIKSNVPLNQKQINLLKQIHVLAINRALSVPEVMRDPRKISYYANDELKMGFIAVLMTHVLQNHLSKAKYTEDFFLQNVVIYTNQEGTEKHVDLDDVEERIVQDALVDEVVYDWLIYRAPGSRGIRALSDEKTEAQGLKNFASGLSPISEFSRFERKYFEEKQKTSKENRENAQRAFRSGFVRQVAEAAAKELLKTQKPMDLAKLLFATKDYEAEIQNLLEDMPIHKEIEKMEKDFENLPAISYQPKSRSGKKKNFVKREKMPVLEFKPQKSFERGR